MDLDDAEWSIESTQELVVYWMRDGEEQLKFERQMRMRMDLTSRAYHYLRAMFS